MFKKDLLQSYVYTSLLKYGFFTLKLFYEKRHKEKKSPAELLWLCMGLCRCLLHNISNNLPSVSTRCLIIPCEVITPFLCTDDNSEKQYISAKSYFVIPFNLLVTFCIFKLHFVHFSFSISLHLCLAN